MVKKQLIGECLFVINKRIKKMELQIRLKININELNMKYTKVELRKIYKQFHDKIFILYDLKQKAITKFMYDFNVKAIGYHINESGKKIDLVRVGRYTFHRPVCSSNRFLGVMVKKDIDDIYGIYKENQEYNIKTKEYIESRKQKSSTTVYLPAGDYHPNISFSKAIKIIKGYISYKDKIKL